MKYSVLPAFSFFALVSFVACGTVDDDDDDSPEASDLASEVAGEYLGQGVIGLRPELNYTMTVSRSGANQVDISGDGFDLTVTLHDVDGLYIYASTEGAVEFDSTASPMTLDLAMTTGDTFSGEKQ